MPEQFTKMQYLLTSIIQYFHLTLMACGRKVSPEGVVEVMMPALCQIRMGGSCLSLMDASRNIFKG